MATFTMSHMRSPVFLLVIFLLDSLEPSSGTVLGTKSILAPSTFDIQTSSRQLTDNINFELTVTTLPIVRDAFLSQCRTHSDCPHTLICRSQDPVSHISIDCTSRTPDCWCLNPLQACDSSGDCAVGDVCVNVYSNSTNAYCVPCRSLKSPSRLSSPPLIVDSTLSPCSSYDDAGKVVTPYKQEPVSFVNRNVRAGIDMEPENFFLRGCTSSFDCASFHLSCHTERNNSSTVACPFASNFQYIGHAAGCVCLDYTRTCITSDDCLVSETCVKLFPSSTNSVCVSCLSLPTRRPPPVEQIGSKPRCPSPTPYAASAPYHQRNGHLQRCRSYIDCDGHICVTERNSGETVLCDRLSTGCVCLDLFEENACRTSDDCDMGERCVKLYITSKMATCVPCSALTSLSHKRVPLPVLMDADMDDNGSSSSTSAGERKSQSPCDRILSVKDTEMYMPGHLERCAVNFQSKGCDMGLSCMTITNGGDIRNCQYNSQVCFCLNGTAANACVRSVDCWSDGLGGADDVRCYKLTETSKVGYCLPLQSISNLDPLPIPYFNTPQATGSASQSDDETEKEKEVETNQGFKDTSEPSDEPQSSL